MAALIRGSPLFREKWLRTAVTHLWYSRTGKTNALGSAVAESIGAGIDFFKYCTQHLMCA